MYFAGVFHPFRFHMLRFHMQLLVFAFAQTTIGRNITFNMNAPKAVLIANDISKQLNTSHEAFVE